MSNYSSRDEVNDQHRVYIDKNAGKNIQNILALQNIKRIHDLFIFVSKMSEVSKWEVHLSNEKCVKTWHDV